MITIHKAFLLRALFNYGGTAMMSDTALVDIVKAIVNSYDDHDEENKNET